MDRQTTLTVNQLIKEYENNLDIKLSTKERMIFSYAYFIGHNNLDFPEEEEIPNFNDMHTYINNLEIE